MFWAPSNTGGRRGPGYFPRQDPPAEASRTGPLLRLAPADLRPRRLLPAHLLSELVRVGHVARGHLLHQLAHLAELLDELVDRLDPGAGAGGDASAPGAVDDLGITALLGSHRE